MTALKVIDDRSNPPPRVVFLRSLAARLRASRNGLDLSEQMIATACDKAATEYEEMLAALRQAVDEVYAAGGNGRVQLDSAWLESARDAIAKAEGRS